MKSSRLKGHALKYDWVPSGDSFYPYTARYGCRCGQNMDEPATAKEARAWHRAHKAEVLAKMDKVLDSLTDLMQEVADEDPDFCDRLAADNDRMMKAAVLPSAANLDAVAAEQRAAEAKESAE
jgi:hypothetical protein